MAWAAVKDVAEIIGMSEQAFCKKYCAAAIKTTSTGRREVSLPSLPVEVRNRCHAIIPLEETQIETMPIPVKNGIPSEADGFYPDVVRLPVVEKIDPVFRAAYNRAPKYNKAMFDRYYPIARDCLDLNGEELDAYIDMYNREHPDAPVTSKTIYRKCRQLRDGGKIALLGGYGKVRGSSIVPDDLYRIFKAVYLSNPGITMSRAYKVSAGEAIKAGYAIDDLPKVSAFVRRLRNDVPKAVEVLAREGKSKYNSKCAPHVRRDLSARHVNEIWVSDHVQLDVKCFVPWLNTTERPWLTSWMDVKSGRLIGWHLNAKAPNSDCIFAAFFNAAVVWGIPRIALTDNGADYRTKDIAGHDSLSLVAELNIDFRRAEPYTPQTKPIERLQRELNEGFSVLCRGYCGPNPTKKPESLSEAVKQGNIDTFDELNAMLGDYINNVLNKRIVTSGHLKGKSPTQAWNEGYEISKKQGVVRMVAESDLRLMCWRRSRPATIQQGTVLDRETGRRYTSDELWQYDRRKVYLYRNHRAMDIAHVYDAESEMFLCEASMRIDVQFFAEGEVEQAQLGRELAQNTHINNSIKEAATSNLTMSTMDMIDSLKTYNATVSNHIGTEQPNDNTCAPILLTRKSGVLAKIEEQKNEGLQDLSYMDNVELPRRQRTINNSFLSDEEVEAAAADGDPEAIAILARKKVG